MSIKLGIIMDPIQKINFNKDTSLALLLEAQRRSWTLYYMEQQDLFISNGKVFAKVMLLSVKADIDCWYNFIGSQQIIELADLDVILMRKDPPVDRDFVHTTHMLDLVASTGTLVVNNPQALRDYNEKLFVTWFPQCCPPHLVTSDVKKLLNFTVEHSEVVLKQLDSFGGSAVYKINVNNYNNTLDHTSASVSNKVVNSKANIKSKQSDSIEDIILQATAHGTRPVMAQRYIEQVINQGDKRILLINGKPFPYALARVPAIGDFRGNLAAGATGVGVSLTERDYWLCAQIAPILQAKGLVFVGLDVIGDYITEINITSPTCVQEIKREHGVDASVELLNCIENLL